MEMSGIVRILFVTESVEVLEDMKDLLALLSKEVSSCKYRGSVERSSPG